MDGSASSGIRATTALDPERLQDAVLELIRRTATELPPDVKEALHRARQQEEPGSRGELAMSLILRNLELAEGRGVPACQDTGTPLFYVHHPEGVSTRRMRQAIEEALRQATARQVLRPNAVDPVTGANSGVNVGTGFPPIHFEEWDEPSVRVDLMLKGGGCENVGAQYSLPSEPLQAGRDLEGVRKVVLDCVVRAEGKGCPPGVLGVCIGGDRSSGYEESKRQLLRPLDDRNPDPALAALEERILDEANRLEIGPLGFGGRSTLLGVKVGALHRLPASYFVTVSYMCWEYRRRTLLLRGDEPPVIR
ncbi:fumarate hydratase [Limnochorda pilosa]|uniref:Fumarate hydratase n=1 Tax=Limnochorda pilosa TaxID=1555112 RepID=A0A0K2SJ89_LIMPI|nr:fumarate hydratase [Limnochorda pilosa]BAS27158.1 fumarate hydratase [Limnochorda pilosa]